MSLLILLFSLLLAPPLEPKSKIKPKAQHVLVIGIDGWGGYSLAKAHDIPNIQSLMHQGCYTVKKRSVLPSDSGVNWASMFNGSCPELHGYTTWNSHTPEIPSVELNEHGKFPTIFSILRKARPDVVTGCIAEWDGIKHVVDSAAIDFYDVVDEKDNEHLTRLAESYIKERKPTLLAVCYDQLDHIGHQDGHDTPAYYKVLEHLDRQVGRIIQALKDAGIYDDTVVMMTADHGGINKGHGGQTLEELEIPFIVCGKGIKTQGEISDVVMQYDTAATIAEVFRLKRPQAWRGDPIYSVFR